MTVSVSLQRRPTRLQTLMRGDLYYSPTPSCGFWWRLRVARAQSAKARNCRQPRCIDKLRSVQVEPHPSSSYSRLDILTRFSVISSTTERSRARIHPTYPHTSEHVRFEIGVSRTGALPPQPSVHDRAVGPRNGTTTPDASVNYRTPGTTLLPEIRAL